jgi:hypothetical protein
MHEKPFDCSITTDCTKGIHENLREVIVNGILYRVNEETACLAQVLMLLAEEVRCLAHEVADK